MRIPRNKWLALALLLVGFLAAGYQFVNYAGLYRWASELQISLMGMYLPYVSALPLLLCFIPYQLTQPPPDLAAIEARLAVEDSFATHEEWMIHKQQIGITGLRRWLPVFAVLSLGAFAAEYAMPKDNASPTPIDLASIGNNPPPLGVFVTIHGQPDSAHVVTLSRHGTRINEDISTVPMIVPGDTGGARFFVSVGRQDSETRQRLAELERTGVATGYLSENGLDGETRTAFERSGLRIASPHYMLGQRPLTAQGALNGIGFLAGIIALIMGLLWLYHLLVIRKYRRQLAEG